MKIVIVTRKKRKEFKGILDDLIKAEELLSKKEKMYTDLANEEHDRFLDLLDSKEFKSANKSLDRCQDFRDRSNNCTKEKIFCRYLTQIVETLV